MERYETVKQKLTTAPGGESDSLPGSGMTAEERYTAGMELFRAGQYQEAFPYLKRACSFLGPKKDRFPDGQAALGWLYEGGLGTRADPGMALLLYKIAANSGDRDGMSGVVRLVLKRKTPSPEDCQTALDCARQLDDLESIPALEQKLDAARLRAPKNAPDEM